MKTFSTSKKSSDPLPKTSSSSKVLQTLQQYSLDSNRRNSTSIEKGKFDTKPTNRTVEIKPIDLKKLKPKAPALEKPKLGDKVSPVFKIDLSLGSPTVQTMPSEAIKIEKNKPKYGDIRSTTPTAAAKSSKNVITSNKPRSAKSVERKDVTPEKKPQTISTNNEKPPIKLSVRAPVTSRDKSWDNPDNAQTLEIENIPSKTWREEDLQSSTSTVIINESPRGNRTHKGFSDESEDALEVINSSQDAEKSIENSTASKDSSKGLSQSKLKPKNKINLEIYLKMEGKLTLIKDAIETGGATFTFCKEYIQLAPQKDREEFEKIVRDEADRKIVRSSFILERLAVVLTLYFSIENKDNEKMQLFLKNLIIMVHQNYMIFGHLISTKIKDKTKSNIWINQLFELVAADSCANFSKEDNVEKMKYNNTTVTQLMKNLLISIQNKELLYGFNSIILQLEKISLKEAYHRLLKSFSVFISEKELRSHSVIQQQGKGSLLKSTVKSKVDSKKASEDMGYLPKLEAEQLTSTYTLVVDLDETLVHYAEIPGKFNELRVRPYVDHFLKETAAHYEIVIFTAAMQEYADWVLNNIDKTGYIKYRLYRHHATSDGLSFIKDLSKLGRDLSKMIIVDNLSENFKLQPDNGIFIKPWYDDHEDTALLELTPLLVEIARKKCPDVRVALKKFREQMMENIENGIEDPHLHLKLD